MNLKKNMEGFTLVEILIVISIISLLFVLVVPQVNSAFIKARESGIRTDFRDFQMASEMYLKEKMSGIVQPLDLNMYLGKEHEIKEMEGVYTTKSVDAWKRNYEIEAEDNKIIFISPSNNEDNKKEYMLVSYKHENAVFSCTIGFLSNNISIKGIKNLPEPFHCGDTISTSSIPETALESSVLTADTVTKTSVHLSWSSVSAAQSYELKRNGAVIYSGTNRTYQDEALNPSTTYLYSLVTKNGELASDSSEVSVTTSADEVVIEDGTCAHPYIINDINELQEMANGLSNCYTLGNDIDASATSTWNGGLGFNPIGYWNSTTNSFVSFEGVFDGNGHTISNLTINRTDFDEVALFGSLTGTIKNLSLVNVNISSTYCASGLVGNNVGTIEHVSVQGKAIVTGTNNGSVGLIACQNYGNITNTVAIGDASGYYGVGVSVGYNDGDIMNSHSLGTVQGSRYIGGLAGYNVGNIFTSYSTANVSGDQQIGGLVGRVDSGGVVRNSYALGNVVGIRYVGGLSGNNGSGQIYTSYSTGTVQGSQDVGGLNGFGSSSVLNDSFWDVTTSGKETSVKGTGKTTIEMKNQSTYTNWDFTSVWGMNPSINNGYPYLKENMQN